tara:strand:- start:1524 stop:2558 length:1035 start_codon:yes stop_codon:yes gene_type:complete
MATTNVSLDDVCQQRKKQFLFAVPPPRNTILDKSPYLKGYTSEQLNMRRKAEILKYAGNKQSTKQNSFTKKELYKNAMMGNNRRSSRVLDCPNTGIIYTKSGASGVPGPSVDLYMDESVPLYNYETGTEPKGITQPVTTDKWTFIAIDDNVFFNDDEEKLVTSLNITDIIDLPSYTYRMSIPVGFTITGKKTNSVDTVYEYNNLSITLDNTTPFEFVVKYNNGYVQNVTHIVDYAYDTSNLKSFTFDISNNADSFNATLYAGVLNISNINLYTEPGYVYDFYVKPKLSINVGNIDVTSTFYVEYDVSYGILMNISETNVSDASGCILTTSPSTSAYVPFSITNM